MKLVRLTMAVVFTAMLASSAMAAVTPVDDDSNPPGELDLYEIYNAIYGTNFTSTTGATVIGGAGLPGDYTGGMDDLFIMETGVFTGTENGSAEFFARYAGHDQRFGYYTNPGAPSGDPTTGVSNGDFVHLFDVAGTSQIIVTPGTGPVGVINSMDFPIGFYNNAPLGGVRTWYSEEGLNLDGEDHMVAFHAIDMDGNILTDRFIIGFEDGINLNDQDYNDLVVEVFIPGFTPRTPEIPEPATIGLMLIGLAGIAARRRFTA